MDIFITLLVILVLLVIAEVTMRGLKFTIIDRRTVDLYKLYSKAAEHSNDDTTEITGYLFDRREP